MSKLCQLLGHTCINCSRSTNEKPAWLCSHLITIFYVCPLIEKPFTSISVFPDIHKSMTLPVDSIWCFDTPSGGIWLRKPHPLPMLWPWIMIQTPPLEDMSKRRSIQFLRHKLRVFASQSVSFCVINCEFLRHKLLGVMFDTPSAFRFLPVEGTPQALPSPQGEGQVWGL